jgi:hypothetical protein
MDQKLFEVAAECAMQGLPSGGDIERVAGRLEQGRHRAPGIVRAAVQGPAAFKDRTYVLESRFVVRAQDGEGALRAVEHLLDGANITHRGLHLSGRALSEADAPPALEAPRTSREGRARPARTPRKATPKRAPARAARAAKQPRRAKAPARTRPVARAGKTRRGGKR